MADIAGANGLAGTPHGNKPAGASLGAVGLTGATTGAVGFYFGTFKDLNIAELLSQQTPFAVGIFTLAVTMILTVGRATVTMPDNAARIVDRACVFFGAVGTVSLIVSFFMSGAVQINAAYVPKLSDEQRALARPHVALEPEVRTFDGKLHVLAADSGSFLVNRQYVEVDVTALLDALSNANKNATKAATDYKHVVEGVINEGSTPAKASGAPQMAVAVKPMSMPTAFVP